MYGIHTHNFHLQATLSASSASVGNTTYVPHHPITCGSYLRYEEDNEFRCEHTKVPHDDRRTLDCINHSVAILILEEAYKALGEPNGRV